MTHLENIRILDDELIEHIANLSEDEQGEWLILEPHPEFQDMWYVDSLNPGFFFDLEDTIGPYRAVLPDALEGFIEKSGEKNYQVAFAEDPAPLMDQMARLNDPPPFKLNSSMEDNINGMLPFQIPGFNKLKNPALRGGSAIWSTGTGKTVLIAGLIRWHQMQKDHDLSLVIVKSNNKVDMQKKLYASGDIESTVIDGKVEKRIATYNNLYELMTKSQKVAITNYEKFREDERYLKMLMEDHRVIIYWDEMPSKLRNRGIQLYDSVGRCLYRSWRRVLWHRRRPSYLRQYQFSATPIENCPGDQYSCLRLIDPDLLGTVEQFEEEYVASYNYFSGDPETWHKHEKFGLTIHHMTHQVDKDDPEVAKYFPKAIEDPRYIDWNSKQRKPYDKMQSIAREIAIKARDDDEIERINVLSLIQILQMLCDAPSMVNMSAKNREAFEAFLKESAEDEGMPSYNKAKGSEAATELLKAFPTGLTDEGHTKFEALNEIVLEKHPESKFLLYSTWAGYIYPTLAKHFEKLDIPYVIYTGTANQMQKAKDQFRTDPEIRAFISADSGSDSIDLPEAEVSIDFNLPWKPSTMLQRRNRKHRVDSPWKTVWSYALTMVDSVEERRQEIIAEKWGHYVGIYKGRVRGPVNYKTTSEDLFYILTGERD